MTSRIFCISAFLALISATQATLALEGAAAKSVDDEANPHLWKPRTKSVAVFKDGFGFFLRQGPVELRDGWAVAKEIPPAKFGTLAIFSVNKDESVDVVGSGAGEIVEFDGVDAGKDIETKHDRLQAALKLDVQLTYKHQETEHSAAGKLLSIGPDFAVLEASGNSFAVPVAEVIKMQLLELPLRVHVAGEDKKPAAAKVELGLAYLREGITWIPEYSMRMLDDTSAELTLRGTLVNEAEDLIHCDVNFVVGVPHFAHSQYMAPIAVGQIIRSVGAAVAPREVQTQIMNRSAITSNSMTSNQFGIPSPNTTGAVDVATSSGGASLSSVVGNLPRIDAAGASDYTVYTKKDLTVRRGERAIVTLFVKKIAYSHVYRWSPPAIMEHYLVAHNDTDTAWTTGPVLAVSGDQPLSEDLLKYTPLGGNCEIPLTASINIAHQKSEGEVDRRLKNYEVGDKQFDLVTIEGTLKLKNFEKRDAEIAITTAVRGKPISASDNGAVATDPEKLQLLEREGTVNWTLKLKPGDAKELKYKYERYVPSR